MVRLAICRFVALFCLVEASFFSKYDGTASLRPFRHQNSRSISRSSGVSEQSSSSSGSNRTIAVFKETTSALSLQEQAARLRAEADGMRRSLEEEKERRLAKQTANVDRWVEEVLIQYSNDNNGVQVLNSVEQAMQILKENRYSQEQVNRIFERLCDTLGPQSRSNCSPLTSLLVDAAGKLDEVERDENPNKRWSGKVERKLRRKLFHMDFGTRLPDEDEDDNNFWSLRF